MIEVLLGEKWLPVVPYLQLLVFAGVFYPMHVINVQILTSMGRSDLFLKIEIIKKIIGMPPIFLGIFVGIKAMIIGMIVTSFISLFINTYYTNKLIHLGIVEQLKSISKTFFISAILAITLFPLVLFLESNVSQLVIIFSVSILAFFIVIMLSQIMKMEEFYEIKDIIINIKNRNGRQK